MTLEEKENLRYKKALLLAKQEAFRRVKRELKKWQQILVNLEKED
jgi:hypothetical protein